LFLGGGGNVAIKKLESFNEFNFDEGRIETELLLKLKLDQMSHNVALMSHLEYVYFPF
jgi:hypothetical protein